jgi:hypothetical protein
MKTNRKFTVLRLLVLALLVAGFNAKPLSAQDYKGKFTLLSATQWGNMKLPAGDYSFRVEHELGSLITVLRGTQTVAWIRPEGVSQIKSGRSEIVLEGGNVRKVNLPTIGVSLRYNLGRQAAPPEPQLAQIIPAVKVGSGR